jgi:hypothetical protein
MYRYVEQPFRRSPHLLKEWTNKRFCLTCVFLAVAIALPSANAWATRGWEWRIADYIDFKDAEYGGEGFSWRGKAGNEHAANGAILYGDSHAKQYLSALIPLLESRDESLEWILHSACLSFPKLTNVYQGKVHQDCVGLWNELKEKARGNKKTIILAYRWKKELSDYEGAHAVKYDESMTNEEKAEYFERLLSGLNALMKEVGEDRHFILIGNVPSANLPGGYLNCAFRPLSKANCHTDFSIEEGELYGFRSVLESYTKGKAYITFLDPYKALCDSDRCYVVRGRDLYYSDHAHLTKIGAKSVIHLYTNELIN